MSTIYGRCPTCGQTWPAEQPVVTDDMLDAAYDALEVGGGCAQDVPEAAMRAAIAAALAAQRGQS